MNPPPPTQAQLLARLHADGFPTPSPEFLLSILTPNPTTGRIPPLQALTATAKHRILSTPLTPTLLSPSTPFLPATISSPTTQSHLLTHDTPVQILDILDISTPKWTQVTQLEDIRKGSSTSGRRVIQLPTPPSEDSTQQTQTQTQTQVRSRGTYKLQLVDVKGTQISAFELQPIPKLDVPPGMGIGCKVMLKKGTRVARGVVLLEVGKTVVLGGRVEVLGKAWREGLEGRLREGLGDV
ncbi:hypothetical protein GLAREA_10118 [Glarea lozoyensis ATCC 20868]|uniref:RecQ-mediated genome instability protein 1 n=1 Tax=Glarea lozoyensis (strain ATCC 20868 / MF5171) TaxID=1116229 RepID=S3DBD9_GLAL2|nr:uncharacterized protein GLAREA_10118 [Glarea lozoyensis ATCC 20868]EPE34424.1 hypothetical protein GLAREA_10118 [Glarea lozoyensis ATCC 20868]